VLTHESAPVDEQMPYFGQRLAPLRPVWCYGRSAKLQPSCPPKTAIYHWFQEMCQLVMSMSETISCIFTLAQTHPNILVFSVNFKELLASEMGNPLSQGASRP